MPVAPVDERGTKLFYTDTGSLPTPNYKTLVIVHGYSWHSAVFSRLLPLAPKHGIRLICVNRRDFPSSTPYAPQEIDPVRTGDAQDYAKFMNARAQELGRFIHHLLEVEGIPGLDEKGQGGVSLLGWSLGNVFCLSLLDNLNNLPPNVAQSLEKNLDSYIMYDAPHWALALKDPPPGSDYRSALKEGKTQEDFIRALNSFLSGYYHNEKPIRDPSKLLILSGNTGRIATSDNMSPEELKACFDIEAQNRSDVPILRGIRFDAFNRIARKVLFGEGKTQPYKLPCRIYGLWGEQSCWITVFAGWSFTEHLRERKERGEYVPPIPVVWMKNGNHFAHWDEPEDFMKISVGLMHGPPLVNKL
ncbi:alpha/beta-hydrolase [Sistotremastrum niveocremeum HHB9708]|uniref:Alpha/beta-hydrolase n=1 Tax=Sistotremastrum niveocremeum HHB9708 TaxID=1314777 RepID=A0A164VKE5_9AGAM|nr:alpha/beta-hydrolase [Sistotremastrum niveocremeum HHB9708]